MLTVHALDMDSILVNISLLREDMVLYQFPPYTDTAITYIFAQGSYSILTSKTADRLSQHILCMMVETTVTTHKPCCIDVRPFPASLDVLSLQPHDTMIAQKYIAYQHPKKDILDQDGPKPVTPPGPLLIVECPTKQEPLDLNNGAV
jgi:hypothetical protein